VSNEILIILLLILLNGVFSGAEIAILSLRKTRLAELVDEGRAGAGSVTALRADPERFLATVQIGITVVGSAAAAFGGASLAADFEPIFAAVPFLAPYAPNLALGLVVVLVSFLSLVLGELVPKSLALRAGESYALFIGRPLLALSWFGGPFVALLTGASNVVLRAFGDSTTFTEARLSKDEIVQMVDEATTVGSVDAEAGEIAARALDLVELDAYTVMVPRDEIVMIQRSATVAELGALVLEHHLARFPVFEGSRDNIVGVVNARDVLAKASSNPDTRVDEVLYPVLYVADSMTATSLLRALQGQRTYLALVIDEQGTIVGLVSIEDLVEELVGEILNEHDPIPKDFTRSADGSWLIPGATPLHEVQRVLDIDLPEGDYATLAGLCLSVAGRIPAIGDVIAVDEGLSAEIVDAGPRRIRSVRLRVGPPSA
jgi:putative hemolysin